MKIKLIILKRIVVFIYPLFFGFSSDDCTELLFYNYYNYCDIEPYPSNVITSSQRTNGELIFIASHKIFYPVDCKFWEIETEYTLNDMSTHSDTNVIIVGDNGIILKFSDHDQLYGPIMNPAGNSNLNCISTSKNNNFFTVHFYIAGDNGTIIKSIDKGNTWELVNFPYNYNLESISGDYSGDTIIVGGSAYSIYKTTNGGETWEQIQIGLITPLPKISGSDSFNRIYFYDDNIGFIGGPFGLITKTTDGGNSWHTSVISGFDEINDIYFISPDSGVAVGSPGIARFTTDGGNTWVEDVSVTNYLDGRTITKVFALSKDYGFVFGEGDINTFIAKDSTYLDSLYSPTSVEEEHQMPKEFALMQNYPNPFNPITNIEFQIKEYGFVSLKIFDLLGNEIATLVDEEKSSGEYKVEFDASGLTSGIYFYQVTAGDFSETKKLVLLK